MARLVPPANERPVAEEGGQHSQAWGAYFQEIADELNRLQRGVTDGSEAASGQVGEYLTASGGTLGLASGVHADLATLPLTAGDWEVWGHALFEPAATTIPRSVWAWIGDAPGTPAEPSTQMVATFGTGTVLQVTAPVRRFLLSASATVYLSGSTVFDVASMSGHGTISARRVR